MTDAHVKVELEGVSQRFGDTQALAPTDLAIRRGEFVAVIGPSGCGKTTLFNILSGILPPTSGRVRIDGKDTTGRPGHVGYMLQKDLLVPSLSALENITLGGRLHGRVSKAQEDAAAELAQHYGLGDFLDHFPHAMSGGMRQRVALMRTLAFARDVMLLDEPFGALDSQTRLDMQQWLLRVWAETGSTVLFVTHDIDEALFLADRVVVMSPRPGRVSEIMEVALPRPRSVDVLTTEPFMVLKRRALDLIYGRTTGVLDAAGAMP
ncbi:Bicarbonate transport ATP-binding protein CmpD [Clavibacter michiganensis]|uniref:Bicarbonate transport ATP-binding protein CmpD n=1 Tax=Clavibacter michiganensis TaxID=28447 RepID=A0A251YEH2_9MICO|nr:ABC transporter ATP-binding protein [Clavibacter michiganensis]OUE22509.1 Bicarbonate transport ATP-binding protein CmpD [Clavibacter michiganensis]